MLKIFCYAAENTTGLFSKKEFVEFFFVLLGVYNIDVDAGCSQLREELCKSMQVLYLHFPLDLDFHYVVRVICRQNKWSRLEQFSESLG